MAVVVVVAVAVLVVGVAGKRWQWVGGGRLFLFFSSSFWRRSIRRFDWWMLRL